MDDQLIWRAGVTQGAVGVSLLLFRLWMKGRALYYSSLIDFFRTFPMVLVQYWIPGPMDY
jgi:hypothetical protein